MGPFQIKDDDSGDTKADGPSALPILVDDDDSFSSSVLTATEADSSAHSIPSASGPQKMWTGPTSDDEPAASELAEASDPDLTDCSENERESRLTTLTLHATIPNFRKLASDKTYSFRTPTSYLPRLSRLNVGWNFYVKHSPPGETAGIAVFLCLNSQFPIPSAWGLHVSAVIGVRVRITDSQGAPKWKTLHQNAFGTDKNITLSKVNNDQGFWGLIPYDSPLMTGSHGDDLHLFARITKLSELTNPDFASASPSHALRTDVQYNGLVNQGATCYLNSLLQSLFHIGAFRRAVYQLPPAELDDWKTNIPFALQRLFFRLQFSQTPVNTNELTSSFGWSADDSFAQQDLHELLCVLMDRLETKMKGTAADGRIPVLFSGKLTNYIKCINVDYTTERSETFNFLSLVVKGCRDIYQSFQTYIEEETLDGSNQYSTEQFGHQDARKGIRFDTLPPVLNLHLKRWELHPDTHHPYKVNDHYQFYSVLDLSKFLP